MTASKKPAPPAGSVTTLKARPRLAFHFSGMCLFVTDDKGKRAKMILSDPRVVRAHKHTPVLIIKDHKELEGDPDASFSMPNSSDEWALWSLEGRTLEIAGNFKDTSLTIARGKIPPGWTPTNPNDPAEWAPIDALANIGEIALTKDLEHGHTGPSIDVPFGKVTAMMPLEEPRRKVLLNYTLDPNEPPLSTPRAMSDRICWELPETSDPVRLRLRGGGRDPRIYVSAELDTPMMISNASAGGCLTHGSRHFQVYYEEVKARRRPILFVHSSKPETDPPDFPEICRPGGIIVDSI